MRTNVFAYTEIGKYPPAFISVNKEEDDTVSFTVRSQAYDDSFPETAFISLNKDQVKELVASLSAL